LIHCTESRFLTRTVPSRLTKRACGASCTLVLVSPLPAILASTLSKLSRQSSAQSATTMMNMVSAIRMTLR